MELKKIGGFWKKLDKNGKTYLSGQIELNNEKITIFIFPNSKKEKENQPDRIAYEVDRKPVDRKPVEQKEVTESEGYSPVDEEI